GGSGQGNYGGVDAVPIPMHERTHSLTVTLPPLGVVFFQREVGEEEEVAEPEGTNTDEDTDENTDEQQEDPVRFL
ncbi:MAG TPA: alpha amylase C-terminal domain-containing protein, partial [Thermoanaerobaculia bacterium]|nr:alpha amylase C-terminal domain-containing protein [Thermoanaerobaculia bacterium]